MAHEREREPLLACARAQPPRPRAAGNPGARNPARVKSSAAPARAPRVFGERERTLFHGALLHCLPLSSLHAVHWEEQCSNRWPPLLQQRTLADRAASARSKQCTVNIVRVPTHPARRTCKSGRCVLKTQELCICNGFAFLSITGGALRASRRFGVVSTACFRPRARRCPAGGRPVMA